jgi:hypothetical protein
MATISAVYRNGTIVPTEPVPADWPEEQTLRVGPTDGFSAGTEEEQGDDPESIARWLAWFDSLPAPPAANGDEVARILHEHKAWQIGQWDRWTADAGEARQ